MELSTTPSIPVDREKSRETLFGRRAARGVAAQDIESKIKDEEGIRIFGRNTDFRLGQSVSFRGTIGRAWSMRLLLAGCLIRSLCASACLVWLTQRAGAADSNKPLTEYTHTVWTHKDGIPSAFIYSIAQTQDGYLWLATTDGLVRFDGVRFVHWRPKTGHTELLGVVRSLCAARDGSLWIGTGSGLVGHIRGDNLTSFSMGAQPEAMLEDRDGTLWVTTEDHVLRFR